jgi:hypothetical protein
VIIETVPFVPGIAKEAEAEIEVEILRMRLVAY